MDPEKLVTHINDELHCTAQLGANHLKKVHEHLAELVDTAKDIGSIASSIHGGYEDRLDEAINLELTSKNTMEEIDRRLADINTCMILLENAAKQQPNENESETFKTLDRNERAFPLISEVCNDLKCIFEEAEEAGLIDSYENNDLQAKLEEK